MAIGATRTGGGDPGIQGLGRRHHRPGCAEPLRQFGKRLLDRIDLRRIRRQEGPPARGNERTWWLLGASGAMVGQGVIRDQVPIPVVIGTVLGAPGVASHNLTSRVA